MKLIPSQLATALAANAMSPAAANDQWPARGVALVTAYHDKCTSLPTEVLAMAKQQIPTIPRSAMEAARDGVLAEWAAGPTQFCATYRAEVERATTALR
ncbi:hypothetical protein [Bosea sp. BIWAKO-01]|uniref:hypothetical protein n=1 Tax=Bosea sp. BIWAKO-01 TaxID=506668 RepID=UPI000852C067|nr:hypothetical protein [Bosea sp. BIWAKO-01]GAU87000.1 hypothetical protein BIWAKO_06953 [Bosea sp. BIWAKO-01]